MYHRLLRAYLLQSTPKKLQPSTIMKFTITETPNPNFWAPGTRLTKDQAVKVLGLNPAEVFSPSRMASRMLSLGFHFRIEREDGDSPRDQYRIQNAANSWLPRDF
jgi:hypothetical protein